MTRYHIDETHAGARTMLEAEALTIQRTTEPFSRSPADLTLEQTVNANAASRLTGIESFSQSVSARRRWMFTRSLRNELNLLNKSGLKPKAHASEIKQIWILTDGKGATMDLFLEEFRDESPYCILTGKVIPADTAENTLSTQTQCQK